MGALMYGNPAKRGRKKKAIGRARSPAKTARRRRYARNPISARGVMGNVKTALTGGVIGAAGAVGVEALIQKATFIPMEYKTGNLKFVTQVAASVALGMIVSKLTRKKHIGSAIAVGGVVVGAAGIVRNAVAGPLNLSASDMSGYGDGGLLGNQDLLGFYSPGPNFDQVPQRSGWYDNNFN